jgi:hypothetical protein
MCTPQVGMALVFVEYDRTRRKDAEKQKKEAAKLRSVEEAARVEREVRCAALRCAVAASRRLCSPPPAP